MSRKYTSVLAVDDDPILLQVLTAFFAKHGIENVLTAHNGTEGARLYKANRDVSLIVTDLHMPDANGIEFLDRLKSAGCDAPVLIISSADERAVMAAGALANAYQLNFLGALPKPVDHDELATMLSL